ncbi:MAG: GAF domain-containing protein [Chloroflexota bacterium]|nr:GAF domain-containing protein [Chloroflexota bacterium]MBI5704210.1 GAF domain-containing protein [Chloroflexota bacterium]
MTNQNPNETVSNFFVTAFFTAAGNQLQLTQFSDPQNQDAQATIPRGVELLRDVMEGYLKDGPVTVNLKGQSTIPPPLLAYPKQLGCEKAAYVPILQDGQLRGVVLIGAREGQKLDDEVVTAFNRTIRLTANSLTAKISPTEPLDDRRAAEMKALNALAANAASVGDLQAFYSTIYEHVRNVIGDYGFVIALYEKRTNSISVPFLYEEGKFSTIESFPLGEGLTSILIRTREPLMLVDDTMNRALAMGAKIAGKPARSWLGVPLVAQGEAIGALIIQDIENEHSFDEEDLNFMIAVANQVSGVIYNVRVLEESKRTALQFETAAEIARDISSSLRLDELLEKAVNLIRSRFNFYHASVFLKDASGEYVVIREATGDAGAQLKRSGFKLGIGSKSIVGFAAGKGEALIVNDTTRDATYYPNPLLPDTRAEAALPLRVGDRVVGVLDVQSKTPYAFAEDNLRTLQILADQLGIAVVNTELFAETQEHLAQHRLLHHITTSAASGTTLEEALESAVSGLQVTLGGDRVTILLADREKKYLEVKAAVGYAPDIYEVKIPIGSGITGWAAEHRRTLRINNVQEDARYVESSVNTRSELAIPMIYRGELLGVLNVESEQLNAYTESDEELLGTLGGSLAAVIANARLLEQIRAQAERERTLFEITDKIRRTTDIQTILTTTVSELTRVTGANRVRAKLGIMDEETRTGNETV